jgi:hypothetical protein
MMFQKLYGMTGQFSGKGLKKWLLRRMPVYVFLLFVTLLYGVKGLMTAFLLILSFFLGWTFKGLIQAVKDWRLSQTMTRVHFSQVEYDSMQRENRMLHEALQAFRDATGKRGNGVAAGSAPAAASPARPRQHEYDPQAIQEMILQMGGNRE